MKQFFGREWRSRVRFHIIAVMQLKLWKDVKGKKTNADAYFFNQIGRSKLLKERSFCER